MAQRDVLTLAVGITLIVFGILLIIGSFTLERLLPLAGIILTVLGVLILARTLPGGTLIGIVALVIGLLMLQGLLDLPGGFRDATKGLLRIINVIAGVILLVLGISKIRE